MKTGELCGITLYLKLELNTNIGSSAKSEEVLIPNLVFLE